MGIEWFCQLMGSELGPYSSMQLIDMARTHRITPEDLIRKGKIGEWVPAYRVRGLFEAASQPAPTGDGVQVEAIAATAKLKENRHNAVEPSEAEIRRGEWYCISNGKKHGPMSFETLQQQATEGQLCPSDRVWSVSSPKWAEARNIPGLVFG